MSFFSSSRQATQPVTARSEQEDARELAGYVPTGDAVDQQAAAWFLAQQGGLCAARAAQLEEWLDAAPSHRHAFERHAATWREIDALPADALAALKVASTASARRPSRPTVQSPARRAWLAGAGRWVPQAAVAAAAVGTFGGGWLGVDHWWHSATFSQNFATRRGQLLDASLPDGSAVQLDTASRAEVAFYRQRREVRLPEGQALFTVTADAAKPFDVLAGPLRITVLGTRFAVRHVPGLAHGGVQVAVEHGRVRVALATAPTVRGDEMDASGGVMLTAGQAVTADAAGRLAAVVGVNPAAIAPWRDGRVSFDGTPLADALAEFERYGETGLRIDDPEVAALRLNGSFNVRKVDNFAEALPRVLPVRLRKSAGGGGPTEIVMAR